MDNFLQMQNKICIFAIENRMSYEVVFSYMVHTFYLVRHCLIQVGEDVGEA